MRESNEMSGTSSPMPDPVVTTYVVGIDIGMEACTMPQQG
jgi:hypothetical protein